MAYGYNTSIWCVFLYLISYNLSRSEGKSDFDPEFEQHENDEREHKYKLIERLRELDSDIIFTAIYKVNYLKSSLYLGKIFTSSFA